MEMESNNYVMCMKCQATHHEDEDHVCDEENPLVPRAFELIKQTPGIDTPRLCLMLHWPPMPDPNLRGSALAKWLSMHHDSAWEETCDEGQLR
jgi:hypothetical protein